MNRYLVLLHFASKIARNEDPDARLVPINEAMRRELQDCECTLSSEVALAFCGVSAKSADELLGSLRIRVLRQDNLSIIELGTEIVTTHPGLAAWQARTAWIPRKGSDRPT